MFNKIRYYIAFRLAQKSQKLIEKGDFTNIMKGLEYLKYLLIILPNCDAKSWAVEKMNNIAITSDTQTQDEGLV